MELKWDIKKLGEYINRYKYVTLILVLGIIMMLIPFGGSDQAAEETTKEEIEHVESFEDQLCNILSLVNGAGKVRVMLSLVEGEEVVYQTDDNISTGNNSETNSKKIVTITDAQRNQQGLVRKVVSPTYKGVIVVCEGAEDPAVRLDMITAVSKVTGLGADKISVLKMK